MAVLAWGKATSGALGIGSSEENAVKVPSQVHSLVSGSGVVSLPSTTRSPGHIIIIYHSFLEHPVSVTVSPSGGPSGEEEVEAVDSTETLREK